MRAGGEPLPEAAAAGRRAGHGVTAERLLLVHDDLVHDVHEPLLVQLRRRLTAAEPGGVYWAITIIILAALEANALGVIGGGFKPAKESPANWPYETVRNVLISGFVLWAIFWLMWEILFAP